MEIMTIFHVTLCRLSAAVLQFFQHFLSVSFWNSSREDATRNKSLGSLRKKKRKRFQRNIATFNLFIINFKRKIKPHNGSIKSAE